MTYQDFFSYMSSIENRVKRIYSSYGYKGEATNWRFCEGGIFIQSNGVVTINKLLKLSEIGIPNSISVGEFKTYSHDIIKRLSTLLGFSVSRDLESVSFNLGVDIVLKSGKVYELSIPDLMGMGIF